MRAELNTDCELTIYVTNAVEEIALGAWQQNGCKVHVEKETELPPQPVAPQFAQPQGEIIIYKGEQRLRSSMTEKELEYYNNPKVIMNRGASPEALAHHASDASIVKVPAHLQGDDSLIGLTIESSNDNGAEEVTPAPDCTGGEGGDEPNR